MPERNYDNNIYGSSRRIDYFTILLDIWRNFMVIILISLSAGLLTGVWQLRNYHPVYTTQITMVVQAGGNESAFSNYGTAQDTATKFEQILNSSILQKKVAEKVGLSGFQGTPHAEVVENTNLLTLSVSAGTAEISFRELRAIMDNYEDVSNQLIGNVILQTLEAPTVPESPDNPLELWKPLALGFGVAFLILIIVFGLFSMSKDTVRNDSEVERKLDARLLVSINHEEKYKSLGSRIRNKKNSILITDSSTSFRYVETMRKLAHRVINRMDNAGAKTLMITSVMENEGKSTVSVNLALAMAQENKRVILMDCDFRKPSLNIIFGQKDKKFVAFGNALTGSGPVSDDLIQKLPNSNLYCIFNTTQFDNSTELIASDSFQQMLDYLKTQVDYIILDTAPMALVADAEELVHHVDASAIVVRQHVVEARDINDYIDVLQDDSRKMIGVIFNNVYKNSLSSHNASSYGYGGHYAQRT